VVVAKKV